MAEHLPYYNHLAAREAGVSLTDFAKLPSAEQAEWIKFALHGPSRLRETLMIAEIRNMFRDFLTGSKEFTPVDEEWIDGIFEHPEEAWERRVEAAKARRRKARIASAQALYERERAAEINIGKEN